MRTLPGISLLLLPLTPVAAVEWIDASVGAQPVAIGAGARALGMGGAFSAVADDATASTWNPAGLTQCERPELAASIGVYYAHATVDGQDDEESDLRPEHISGMLPFYAFGCQQVVGVAWQRTYDFTRRISSAAHEVVDDGMGTIVTVDSDGTVERDGSFATLGLCYAIEPTPGLSLGLTVNQWADSWIRASSYRQRSSDHAMHVIDFGGMLLSSETWLDSTRTTRVLAGTSLAIGGLWQALPQVTVALVAKPGFTLDLESSADIVETNDFGFGPMTSRRSTTTRATLHQPSQATVGTAWRSDDLTTVTCDATWTRWRQYYLEQDGQRRSPVAFYVPPEDFDDLWTLRLGYERICILPGVVLVPRCGALLEWLPAATTAPDAVQAEDVSASSDLWWGLTAGVGVCQRAVIWDAAVQMSHGNDVGAGQFAGPDRTADLTILTARLGVTVLF